MRVDGCLVIGEWVSHQVMIYGQRMIVGQRTGALLQQASDSLIGLHVLKLPLQSSS